VLNLRARNLDHARPAALTPPDVEVETVVEPEGRGKSARTRARVVEGTDLAEGVDTAETAAPKAKATKKAAPKTKKAGGAQNDAGFKNAANAKAPKQTRAQGKSPVRRNAPRSGKG
jgi:hypothetical protein